MSEFNEALLKIKSNKMLFLLDEIPLVTARDKIDIYMGVAESLNSNFKPLSFEEVIQSPAW